MGNLIGHVTALLTSLPAPLALRMIGALVFAEAALFVGFVLPGETAVLFGGALAAAGHLSFTELLVVVVVAAIVGDSVGYEVGRLAGPRLLESRPLRRHRARLEVARDAAAAEGWRDGRRGPLHRAAACRDAGAVRDERDALPALPAVQRPRGDRLGDRHVRPGASWRGSPTNVWRRASARSEPCCSALFASPGSSSGTAAGPRGPRPPCAEEARADDVRADDGPGQDPTEEP